MIQKHNLSGNGWINPNCFSHPHLEKSFLFISKDKLVKFAIELLNIKHNPDELSIEATELVSKLSMVVYVEFGMCNNNREIINITKEIDKIFYDINN